MYIVVNYKSFIKYPKTFYKFNDAFMVYQLLNDLDNIIEYYDDEFNRQIVWCDEYENSNIDSLLNKNDEKYKGVLWMN